MRSVGSVELLDPEARSPGSSRPTGIERIGASWLHDGERLIVAGGLCPGPGNELAAEVLAAPLGAGAAEVLAALVVPRYLHGEVPRGAGQWLLIGGLVTGGEGLSATPAAELLDARASRCERLPDLPFAAAEMLVIGLGDGRVLAAGGYDAEVTGAAAVLDADCVSWRSAPDLPWPRAACTGPIALDERLALFIGGHPGLEAPAARDGLVLDTATLAWRRADVHVPSGAAIVVVEGGFLASGGWGEAGEVISENTLWTWTLR
jgi:hypothetical protein